MIRSMCLLLLVVGEVAAQTLQWRELPNAPKRPGSRFEDLFFLNPDTGWVAASGGFVSRTTDGGKNWTTMTGQFGVGMRSIRFFDGMYGFAGTLTSSTPVMVTTNSGLSWTKVDSIAGAPVVGICGLYSVGDSMMVGVGTYSGSPRFIKTTDRGASWTCLDMSPYASTLIDCFFPSRDTGFVVGGFGSSFSVRNSIVLRTTDGGETWESRYVSTRAGEWCWKISFPSDSIGYVAVERYSSPAYVLKSTDGGDSWTAHSFHVANTDIQGLGFATDSLGWAGNHGIETYETTDGGSTWHLAPFGRAVNRFRMFSDSLGYAVGETVYKYSVDPVVAVADVEPVVLDHRLTHNYPNPFNATTRVRFVLPNDTYVVLKVYDVLGKPVATLANGPFIAGAHEIAWDAGERPSGVYYYRIETGEVNETGRMVFIK